VVDQLKHFLVEVKALKKDIKAETTDQIAKKALRSRAEAVGSRWFNEVAPLLTSAAGYEVDVVEKYSKASAHLIKLSAPNNLRTSYLKALDVLSKGFRDELILPAQQGAGSAASASQFDAFFGSLPDAEEEKYLSEAVACAKAGYLKAAVVLGWCAAIDRIHRRIEKEGFAAFNVASANLASQTKGRFKKFNQTQNVNSLSELRTVFDTTVLWVIEGMGWIDSNQHTRLRSCFDMRNHGAHPGEAPITEFNLLSFFSDIDLIVLSNPKFALA
jgi:hypothetical protein